MLNVNDVTDKCFAYIMGQCTVLTETNCEGCKFYKPKDCTDWVRVKIGDNTYLYDPDEYELRRRSYEQTL